MELKWNEFCEKYGKYKLSRKEAEEVELISREIHEYLNTIDWPYGFRSINEIIGQALDYYVQVYEGYDKDEMIRPFLMCSEVNGRHIGCHILEYIIDRYVFNTKRASDWNGKEWISEDILRFFKYDDESLKKQQTAFRERYQNETT